LPPTAPPPLPNDVGEAVIFRETTMIRRRMLDDDRNFGGVSLIVHSNSITVPLLPVPILRGSDGG
jgi:hypothetical protein